MPPGHQIFFAFEANRRRFRRWFAILCGCAPGLLSLANAPAEELHTVAAIRRLDVEQTQQRTPVRLTGVVTFFDDSLYSRFIQDDTAGIYLQFPTNVGPPVLLPGQLVEVRGVVSPGEYAPVVSVDQIQIKGEAAMPAARQVTYEELASGVEDSQFVEIGGIVRSIRPLEGSPYFQIEITTGGGRITVFAKDIPVPKAEELLDSNVRVRGVCSTQFNHQRQLFAIRLMVPRPADFSVAVPATNHPYAAAARPIGSLLRFAPRETYGHRVKVSGKVIYFEPGAALFLQDGDHGVEVQTKERDMVRPGDEVEALGFVSQGDYTPLLEDAVYRKIGSSAPLVPARVTPDEALTGNHDCQLIRVSARLLDRALYGPEQYLVLQESNAIFQAILKQSGGYDRFSLLKNGSRIDVTGVCRIEPGEWQAGESWRAKSFTVMLRSPDDVVLLESPSWWTLEKVLWIASLLSFLTLAAFGWVAVLQRQVTERTRELEVQIQKRQLAERRREIEQERARVAQDLHDDLGSRLTEVNMLASLVRSATTSGEEKDHYLTELMETARHMVTSLDEIVWAVNPRNDTTASLASYFGSYAQRLLDMAAIACGLEIAEDLPEHPLDPRFRQELFFAFKEALTNVVRHSAATQLWLRISAQKNYLVVEVADNGRGFDPAARIAGADGITNMNARLRAIGGWCEITTEPRRGTSVFFHAPLPRRLL